MADQATINARAHQVALQPETPSMDVSTIDTSGKIDARVKQVALTPDVPADVVPKISETGQTLEPVPGYQGFVDNTVAQHFQNGVGGMVQNFKSLAQLGFTNKSF